MNRSYLCCLVALAVGACDPAPQPGDVGIERVELTQHIQDLANQVPLLAGKPTYVRVFVRGNVEGGAAVPTVGARLTVDGGAAIAPTGTTAVTPPATGSDWRTTTDSFLFEVPPLAGGSHHLRVELVLPTGATVSSEANLDSEFDVRMRGRGAGDEPIAVRAWSVSYGYTDVPMSFWPRAGISSSTWPARPVSDLGPQVTSATPYLPLATLDLQPLPGAPAGSVPCNYTGDAATGGCGGYLDGRAWGAQLIDAAYPNGGETIVVLQPEEAGNRLLGADTVTGRGNHVINLQRNEHPDLAGLTLAHEFLHALGVGHTASTLDFYETSYPRPDGSLGPYVAVIGTPRLHLVPGDDATGAPVGRDIQSYRFPQATSPFTYCKALRTASAGDVTCPRGLDSWDR